MSTRRVVIADDEMLARERVRMMLSPYEAYEVVAECGDGSATVDAILEHEPQLVFLDIKMPGLDGLEVVAALDEMESPPAVVFVTAFERHALQAFDLSAVDYLLKPFNVERFGRAMERVDARLGKVQSSTVEPAIRAILDGLRVDHAYPERFLVRGPTHLYFVRAQDVEWADAQGNYVRLHVAGRGHFVRETMKTFEGKLPPDRFIRVHRSIIVNIDHIQRLEPHGHGEYVITLRDGARVTSSRTHGERLQALLQ
jgi:two-component system, LytTR family, response regulator